jgi:hypothetical protein
MHPYWLTVATANCHYVEGHVIIALQ